MLNAVNVTLVGFSRFVTPLQATGQTFAIFVITVAAAEAAVGLAVVLAIYRRRDLINLDDINLLRW
jgi:NAD(P)H-quinone oxidoreductase subunit 4L